MSVVRYEEADMKDRGVGEYQNKLRIKRKTLQHKGTKE